MKRYIDELTKRIDELLKIYEQHLWSNPDDGLYVSFKDNMIMFNLLHDKEMIDELYLSFEEKERKFYEALCLRTFVLMFGNVMVYKDILVNEYIMYSNEKQKPYFAVATNDKEIVNMIDTILDTQKEEAIKNHKILKDMNNKVKRYLPNIPVLYNLDKRIELSKEMLRGMK